MKKSIRRYLLLMFIGFLLGYCLVWTFSAGCFGALIGLFIYFWLTGFSPVRTMSYQILEAIVKLSLSVMKADKRITRAELYIFRDYMVSNFGSEVAIKAIDILQKYQNETVNIAKTAKILNNRLNYEEKLQILHFLFQIATSDCEFIEDELKVLMEIAIELRIKNQDYEYTKRCFYSQFSYKQGQRSSSSDNREREYQSPHITLLNDDYILLGVKKTDSDEVIKAAHRRLVIANHPDKFQHLGETARINAEKLTAEINAAYNRIKKARKTV